MVIKFIDLFAGIGGFHQAFHNIADEGIAQTECVFASEIDKFARQTYEYNFKSVSPELFQNGMFAPDVAAADLTKIPKYDILCAGFPCQPFSQAGYKRGFQDEKDNRGNMFFSVVRFLKEHQPRAFFLENVRHLIKHDEGQTFATIARMLMEHGYSFAYKVVKASEFGLPQHRPRVFIVGFRIEAVKNWEDFQFPEPQELTRFMSDIFGEPCNKTIGYTLRVGGKASGLMDRRNWDTYLVSGRQRRITSVEGRKMNGFPEHFTFPVSEAQAMKQLGNSVAVPAVEATAREIIKVLNSDE
jgi:DNA (cytosine-5)-methyltransferase 1